MRNGKTNTSEWLNLRLVCVTQNMNADNSYVVLLEADDKNKTNFSFMVGKEEANLVAAAYRDESVPPVYQTMLDMAMASDFYISAVEVCRIECGKCYGRLHLKDQVGVCRDVNIYMPDALVIAMAQNVPIIIARSFLDKQVTKVGKNGGMTIPINSLASDLLQVELQNAIKCENYELASVLRDEIKRRK